MLRSWSKIGTPQKTFSACTREYPSLSERPMAPSRCPDKISVYRLPLCEMCQDETELASEIEITVIHEIAHHFGIDDDSLHTMGWG